MQTDFLSWLQNWYKNLPATKISDVVKDPKKTALVSVDMVIGFCHKGALASPKIASIIPDLISLFTKLHDVGIGYFLLFQDTHDSQTPEFSSYPPHCIKGTEEAETIPEYVELPFATKFTIFEKNSTDAFADTKFAEWLKTHPEVDTFVVVGNCTDICVYQAAIGLKTRANSRNFNRRVVVPANCVSTFDLPVDRAKTLGAFPHDAALLQSIFLYHMHLNGVEVVSRIE